MEEEDIKKSYYAIIPANVRYDKTLPPNAKLLYGEITALSNEKGYCWATNKYFSDLYGVSKNCVSKWIKQLSDNGYIECEIIYKQGSKEIDKRCIKILPYPIQKIYNTPIQKIYTENNTYKNNTSNNTEDIKYIVEFLNLMTGQSYRYTTKKTADLIRARLNEGFTVDDFKTVIEKKTKEWLNTEQAKYLRPETLFGTKFESYLNQLNTQTKPHSTTPAPNAAPTDFANLSAVDKGALILQKLKEGMEE